MGWCRERVMWMRTAIGRTWRVLGCFPNVPGLVPLSHVERGQQPSSTSNRVGSLSTAPKLWVMLSRGTCCMVASLLTQLLSQLQLEAVWEHLNSGMSCRLVLVGQVSQEHVVAQDGAIST